MQLNACTLVSRESLVSECYSTRMLLASTLRIPNESTRARAVQLTISGLWLAYDNCHLAMASGQAASNVSGNGDRPEWTFARFLQNYQNYSSTTWCIANGGLSDHEAMETLAMAAWKDSKSINYALYLRARHLNSRVSASVCVCSAIFVRATYISCDSHSPPVSFARASIKLHEICTVC